MHHPATNLTDLLLDMAQYGTIWQVPYESSQNKLSMSQQLWPCRHPAMHMMGGNWGHPPIETS